MNIFHSGFADLIQLFIDHWKASGMNGDRCGYDLHPFDKFCVMKFPPSSQITQEMVDAWCRKKDTNLIALATRGYAICVRL